MLPGVFYFRRDKMNGTDFDASRAEAFEGRIVDMLNLGSMALMTSLGHRTGLFDVISELPPSMMMYSILG